MAEAEMLLLDVLVSVLDPDLIGRTLDLIGSVQERTRIPMIFIGHAPEEVRRLCDRVVTLSDGRADPAAPARLRPLADRHSAAPVALIRRPV